jgi:type VI secretion system protein ImpJ
MEAIVDIQKPLFWQQGIFLQPHHFQITDRYTQSLLLPYQKLLAPDFWGVIKLDISQGALDNLVFDITGGEFLFPDGSHVVFPGNALLEARSFEKIWGEKDKPLTVFVGLKKWDESGNNVGILSNSDDHGTASKRYSATADPEEVFDLHQPGQQGQVQLLNYVLRIFFESEQDQLGDYILLPVVQLEKDAEEIRKSATFIPPSLTIQSSAVLTHTIKEIRNQIASRGRQLEEYKIQRGIHSAQFGARDTLFLLALRSLNRYIPQMFHLTETPNIHPWLVYGLLRQMIGELSTFSNTVNSLGENSDGQALIKAYDHRDLGKCFLTAQSLITELLDEITAGPEYILELVYDGTYFVSELPAAIFEEKNRFFLVTTTDVAPDTVIKALENIAKLGSRESLPIRIARALPGLGLQHLTEPPQELPRRAQSLYFQIDHFSDQWQDVQQGKNLALYWDTAPEEFKVEFMVVGRS